ncbi:MAG: hypothetical protein Kow00124_04890 [Anaerolineae bacterium]
MPVHGRLLHAATGTVLLDRVRWCEEFGCKLRGLMFRRTLHPDEGLIMAERRASRSGVAIHMLFMWFPIAVIWLDDSFKVIDQVYARPWRLAYLPSRPARYTLEARISLLDQVSIGDVLRFEPNES